MLSAADLALSKLPSNQIATSPRIGRDAFGHPVVFSGALVEVRLAAAARSLATASMLRMK